MVRVLSNSKLVTAHDFVTPAPNPPPRCILSVILCPGSKDMFDNLIALLIESAFIYYLRRESQVVLSYCIQMAKPFVRDSWSSIGLQDIEIGHLREVDIALCH